MRVLHVYKDIYPPVVGGVEKHIHDVCVGLRERFDFTVLVANDRSRTEWTQLEGIPVCKAGALGRFASAPLCPTFPALLKRLASRADLLHYHLPMPTAVVSHLLVRPSAPALVTYHSDIVRQQWALGAYGPFLRAFLRRAALILPTSPNYVESSRFLAPLRDRCRPTPLGVDTAAFKDTPQILAAAREIRGRYGGAALIGFLGRLRAYKGLPYLIEAMAEVRPPETRCLIIGDGPMLPALEEAARRHGVADRVHFLGRRSDEEIVALLHAIDVYCLPSHLRSEAFGLNQVEAMACGKPVVSCALDTGVPFVNLDGQTGRIVPPASPRDLATALNELLASPDLRQRLGRAARHRAVKEFDRSLMLERITRAYEELAGEPHETSAPESR